MTEAPSPRSAAKLFSFRIGVRLALGFAVMLAMIVGSGIQAGRDVSATAQSTAKLYQHPFGVTKGLATIRFDLISLMEMLRDASTDAGRVDTAAKARLLDEIERATNDVANAYLGPKADIQAMRAGMAPFLGGVEKAIAMLAQGQKVEARTYINGELREQMRTSTQSLTAMLDFAAVKAGEFVTNASKIAAGTVDMIWYITGGAIVVGLFVTWLTTRGIVRPLGRLGRDVRALADGERAIEVSETARGDEIGDMAKAVLVLKDNLVAADDMRDRQAVEREQNEQAKTAALMKMAETIEAESTVALGQINQRADEMTGTANGMSARAESTKQSAHAAAEAAREALSTVQTVASAAEELSASIHEISGQMRNSTALVTQAVAAGGEARGTIEALNETVMRIGAVADMIGEIAGKTNLLALNATIEAARAGDAGKGFAVVASEVKQLAAQTARSTGEIAQQLNDVRAATSASVAAVNRIETTITEINAVAGAIAQAVEQQGVATAEIAHTVAQTAEAANTVTNRISEVSQEATETGADAARVHETASGLAQSVLDLRHALTRVVRTSSTDVDRRKAERYQVDLQCSAVVGGSARTAQLIDISAGGAALVGIEGVQAGMSGNLRVPGVGFELPFTIRDASEGVLHVSFNLDQDMATRFSAVPEQLGRRKAA